MRKVLLPALTALLMGSAFIGLPRLARAQVVISQIYGGGGNPGASFNRDFIELFNRGTSQISLSGLSVQYTTASGTFNTIFALPSFMLQPGQYFLVGGASGANGTALPGVDASTNINLDAVNGKVALATGTTPVLLSDDESVIDFVGYGGASDYEGSGAAPAGSNSTSIRRLGEGMTDTDNNVFDFLVGTATPRHSQFTAVPEPGTVALLGVGVLPLCVAIRRRRRKKAAANTVSA